MSSCLKQLLVKKYICICVAVCEYGRTSATHRRTCFKGTYPPPTSYPKMTENGSGTEKRNEWSCTRTIEGRNHTRDKVPDLGSQPGIGYKDLNKACPKDCYPLPELDLKVDALTTYQFRCFLDAHKGYHQTHMAEKYQDKTAFLIDNGMLCYKMMPFELKNAGAT